MDAYLDFTIRDFRIEDYSSLIALWKSAGLPFKPNGRDSMEKIKEEVRKGISVFLVAEKDKKIIGSVIGTHDGRKGWINRVAVDPGYQRNSVAKSLVAEVEKKLDKIGINIFACLIEDWNDRSMQVFEKLGYKKHKDIIYFSKRKNDNI